MGYRSTVHAVMYASEDKWPILKLFVDENIPEDIKYRLEVFEADKDREVKGYYFYFEDVKWYPSYPLIKNYEAFVDKFSDLCQEEDESGLRFAYEFVRIGEDTSDIESVYSGDTDFLLEIYRSVVPAINLTKED